MRVPAMVPVVAAWAACFALPCAALNYSDIPTPTGKCAAHCETYVPPVQTGPSPAEVKRAKEAKDTREAANDAEDKGEDAYRKGDYEAAAKWFREALEYDPDDPVARANLANAEKQINAAREGRERAAREARERAAIEAAKKTDAIRDLTSTADHSDKGNANGDKTEAGRGFDTNGGRGKALPPGTYAGAGTKYDPVVPPARRTPAITSMESQREQSRKEMKVLDQQLQTLDPAKDAVKISEVKQKKSTVESKVQFLNFSIKEALEKPPQPSASK